MVAKTGVVLQEERRTLQAEGFESGLDIETANKKQWYRADGTPLGGLLPVDDYHYKRFKAKGWTLTSPVVSTTAFLDEVILEGQPIEVPGPNVKPKTARQIREAGLAVEENSWQA